jgi:hypothetical protein
MPRTANQLFTEKTQNFVNCVTNKLYNFLIGKTIRLPGGKYPGSKKKEGQIS